MCLASRTEAQHRAEKKGTLKRGYNMASKGKNKNRLGFPTYDPVKTQIWS